MRWEFLFITEEEKKLIITALKSRGFENHYEEIVLSCFDLKEVEDYTENGLISYREEENVENQLLYSKQIAELAQLINRACLNNELTLTTIDKRGNKIKLEINGQILRGLNKVILKETGLEAEHLDLAVAYRKERLKRLIPSKYYIGYVLCKAINELKEKGVFNKENKLIAIQEAGVLFDILVAFKAIGRNDYLTPKEKYDFIKNRVNLYKKYIQNSSK